MTSPSTCHRCSSLCASRHQIVFADLPDSDHPCQVLVVGEAPGADEDAQGKGFLGRAGRTLHHLLEGHGLKRGVDYGCANVVRCRPPENRKPTQQEISHCLPYLAQTIAFAQPRAVLTVGATATRVFTGLSSLQDNLHFLSQHDQDPLQANMPDSLREAWPTSSFLVAMPHTSPLAWNRNAPDGRKWSVVGIEQITNMVQKIRANEHPVLSLP